VNPRNAISYTGFPKPYGQKTLWSLSYFASSIGGASLEVLKEYIRNQALAYRLGDFEWGGEHHGTPEQRFQAVSIGMQGALSGQGFNSCKL
jgi:hypothetical protein